MLEFYMIIAGENIFPVFFEGHVLAALVSYASYTSLAHESGTTGWCDVFWVVVYIPPAAENPSLRKIIPRFGPPTMQYVLDVK